MTRTPFAAVVLAAGRGTRMKSDLPKVLHPLAGRPMILHLLDTLAALGPERLAIAVGPEGKAVAIRGPMSGEEPVMALVGNTDPQERAEAAIDARSGVPFLEL